MSTIPDGRVVPVWRRRLLLGGAIAALVVLPLIPGVLATGSIADLVRIPVESIVALLVLALISWRMLRLAVATAFGGFVARAVLRPRLSTLRYPYSLE